MKEKKTGLIFDKEDINKSSHLLVKLLRKIFYENKITYEQLDEQINLYYNINRHISKINIAVAKSNLLSPLLNTDSLTYNAFNNIIHIVLGNIIIGLDVTLFNESNDVKTKYKAKR